MIENGKPPLPPDVTDVLTVAVYLDTQSSKNNFIDLRVM